jgi:DNA replication protein DnaC
MDASSTKTKRTCTKHGEYTATVIEIMGREIVGGCPVCITEQAEKDAERDRLVKEEFERRRVDGLMRNASIPLRFQAKTFDNYETNDEQGKIRALGISQRYAEIWPEMAKQGTCLIFSGKAGTGKTHLACAIANSVISKGASALFTTVSDALRGIRRAYDKKEGVSEAQAIEELVCPNLLILDEVGMDYGTEHSKTLIFDLLNKRYENMRPTIILTNLDAAALKEYLGERIVDRLREGGGKLVAFNWESHRA